MRPIATVILAAAAFSADAEQLFISDKLVVNVYAEANQDSDKIATLESGDAVDASDKAEGYTHVKLANGREGWVKSSYLTAQTPAIVRVKELEKEHAPSNAPSNVVPAQITEELKQLREQNAALRTETDSLKRAAAAAQSKPAQNPPPTQKVIVHTEQASVAESPAWTWAAAIAAAGMIGFALGYRTVANRIKRKYGKLRIY